VHALHPGGRFSAVLLQLGGGLVLSVPAAGQAAGSARAILSRAATEAVTGWRTSRNSLFGELHGKFCCKLQRETSVS
jgi:hypothetical protein